MPTALHGQHGSGSVQTASLITRIPTGLSGGAEFARPVSIGTAPRDLAHAAFLACVVPFFN